MEWARLIGVKRLKPGTGSWQDWKQHIANECGARCIYCAIHEGRFGGMRNFHVEHYRPKARFPKFENDICNLYLACAVCNVLKSDDWPGDPRADHKAAAYPDPSKTDYNDLFELDLSTFEVASKTVAGQYVAERLMLNRGQLVLQRRLHICLLRLSRFEAWCQAVPGEVSPQDLRDALDVLAKVSALKTKIMNTRPYSDKDTKRSAKTKSGGKRLRS